MPPKSKVTKLDPRIKAEIDALLAEGRYSLDEILAHITKLHGDVDISRSGLGRYAKDYHDVAAEMRQFKEMAAGFAAELGAVPDTEAHQAVVQMMHTLLMRGGMEAIKSGNAMDPKDLMFLGRTIKDLISSVDIREKVADAVREKAATAAETAIRESTKGGARLSADELIDQVRQQIYGIATPA